jgi:hypothetical protein
MHLVGDLMTKPVNIITRVRNVCLTLLTSLFDTSLPPATEPELELIAHLRETFRTLQTAQATRAQSSEAPWISHTSRLSELVLEGDPRDFLRWNVIRETMFVAHPEFVLKELRYLQERPDWNKRWRKAIREARTGHPLPYPFYPQSSGNLIHQAYHLAKFEEQTVRHLKDIDFIVEFGGGYGSMCRLFHNLGFEGRYVIFDLPHFSALQEFFLESIDIKVSPIEALIAKKAGVSCLSDLAQLKDIRSRAFKDCDSMFIATWSLSETPIQLRESFLPSIREFSNFLIAYQQEYGAVNNVQFFDEWKESMDQVSWHDNLIEHLPGNSYLFGNRLRTPAALAEANRAGY